MAHVARNYCSIFFSLFIAYNLSAEIFKKEILNHHQLDLLLIQDSFTSFRYINNAKLVEQQQLKDIKKIENFSRFVYGACWDTEHGLINHAFIEEREHFHVKFNKIDSDTLRNLLNILIIDSTQIEELISQYLLFNMENESSMTSLFSGNSNNFFPTPRI